MQIKYRHITLMEVHKINDIDASQYIGRAWRDCCGKNELVEINYNDLSWPNGIDYHHKNLIRTIEKNGIAIGAFDENDQMLGFVTVNNDVFGNKARHVLLDQLYITKEHRNKGIGKQLFKCAVEAAKRFEVEKILICAGSAEETIAFYYAMGCETAKEINYELFEKDPRDVQLEYTI